MKNGAVFFLGLFAVLALSWSGIVLGSNAQLGSLRPHADENEGKSYPERPSGVAARGALVYADLGCASCHTQQVRRSDFGADVARGWGDRQSYARDYIGESEVQLGQMRVGPDLGDLAARKPPYDAEDLMKLLYVGTPDHPSYRFLFENRNIIGERSVSALKLTGANASKPGFEIVPTERARTLVAYLLSLNQSYNYPEESSINVPAPTNEGESANKTGVKSGPVNLPPPAGGVPSPIAAKPGPAAAPGPTTSGDPTPSPSHP